MGLPKRGSAYRAQLGAYGDRLIVLTGQTPEQVVALSRRADVLVHPRLACRENYSVQSKIAVYLAAGRPIVATDFGDYQTLLGATGAGLLTAVAPATPGRRHHQGPDRPLSGDKFGRRDPPSAQSSISQWTATSIAISTSTNVPSRPARDEPNLPPAAASHLPTNWPRREGMPAPNQMEAIRSDRRLDPITTLPCTPTDPRPTHLPVVPIQRTSGVAAMSARHISHLSAQRTHRPPHPKKARSATSS